MHTLLCSSSQRRVPTTACSEFGPAGRTTTHLGSASTVACVEHRECALQRRWLLSTFHSGCRRRSATRAGAPQGTGRAARGMDELRKKAKYVSGFSTSEEGAISAPSQLGRTNRRAAQCERTLYPLELRQI